jgi:transcription-repair coupling factor (superfamily II helicase)
MRVVSLHGLTAVIRQAAEFDELVRQLRAAHAPRALALPRAARPFVAAALQVLDVPMIYVTSSVETSRIVMDALGNLVSPDGPAPLRFAEPNTAFYDTVAPVRDVIVQRSVVLAALAAWQPGEGSGRGEGRIVITSPRALMQPTAPADRFRLHTRAIRRDATLSLESMLTHWVNIGYESEQVVERIGTFSRRGGIIDVWSPAHALPVRIELFGNTADSIRLFDPGTQRSGQPLDEVTIAPLDLLSTSGAPATDGGHGPVATDGSSGDVEFSLLDYLLSDALLIIDDEEELREAWRALEEKAQRERETMEDVGTQQGAPLPRDTPYLTWDEFATAAANVRTVVLGQGGEAALSAHPLALRFTQPPHFAGQVTPLLDYLRTANDGSPAGIPRPTATVVVSRQSGRLAELWSERNSAVAAQAALDEPPQLGLTFVAGALPAGFVWRDEGSDAQLILLTDAEIYGQVRPEWFLRARARRAAPEKAFADWEIGDAVVHEDYGIGLYRGLVKLTVANLPAPGGRGAGLAGEIAAEVEREYLLLEYADADRLYVPLHQLDRVTRYVGADDARPALDKLGSGQWEKAKQKATGAAVEIAREMLKLYAARELAVRPPFSPDTPWQAELESSFPFIETDDQLKAIQDVKADLEQPRPMDRLVVGDVGYGKTEVALRAAFKAVQDGKQVAVLVPTTVLAQQHWNTFIRRLASYPIKIEMLSRFRTPAEKREVIDGLADGTVDIVIGTHALVGREVRFRSLGLIVIDEEHRFGVKAKERLKQLREEVDVLTLTATPIPRTLYLGLSGVRAISRIETPPAERLPIISFVGPWDDAIVQQAIRRELDRDGQTFFVHNRVQTIGLIEQKLRRLVPEASMAVAHGQMDERQLAKIMTRFADGAVSILLCTNIIESGLDIPNANTIVIDNADHFGLAELYQLRGRVGRSTIQAYAYFLHDRRSRMTAEARDRLETLRESAGIGAGYSIAMRDLELRGAGDMLGPKQSGHIASIGFDLYTRLLAHEVQTLRALRDGAPLPPEQPKAVTIDLPLTVGLSESYIGDTQLRVQLYRRAASLDSEDKIREFEEELEDRFGRLPQPTRNLTFQLRLKLIAVELGAQSITTDGNRFTIRAEAIRGMNPGRLQQSLGVDALIGRTQVSFLRSGTPEQWKRRLMDVLKALVDMKPAAPERMVAEVAAGDAERAEADLPPMAADDDW